MQMQSWLESWEARVVKVSSEEQASRILVRPGEYCSWAELNPARTKEIEIFIKGKMCSDQAESLRQQLLVEKCRLCSVKISQFRYQLVQDYEIRGIGVLDTAQRYDLPPIALLRAVLSSRLLSNWQRSVGRAQTKTDNRSQTAKRTHKKMVTVALRGSESELLPLSARDRSELAAASNADAASFEGVDPRQKEMADEFEAVIGKVKRIHFAVPI